MKNLYLGGSDRQQHLFSSCLDAASATTCERKYRKIGCFQKNRELLNKLLITDLDPEHHNWGQDINWADFQGSLHRYDS